MNNSRRNFLRGRLSPPAPQLRLPWAVDDEQFIANCNRCGDCLQACPEQIIISADGGFPQVQFEQGGCTFCHACVDVCQQPVFHQRPEPWHALAVIGDKCLTRQQVFCQNCKDACDARAIGFQFGRQGISHPQIDPAACTGCGACVAPCPTQAIQITSTTSARAEP